jgi:transcriptional regulator with XRE-family HTH domain
MATFRDDLAEKIRERHWTLREFSRRSGANAALVSRVIRGQRPPPLASLEDWANAFQLAEAERVDFIEKGRLALCPPEIESLVRNLRKENAALSEKLAVRGRRKQP